MSYQQAIQLLKDLPRQYQQEVIDFIEFLAGKARNSPDSISTRQRNGYGSLKGKVWMSPDFDESLEDFED